MNPCRAAILLLTGSFVLASPSLAAIVKVKDIGSSSNGPNNPSITFNIPIPVGGVAVGNLVVLAVLWGGDATMATLTVTDSKGNTYSKDVTTVAFMTNRLTSIVSSKIATPLVATTDFITVSVVSAQNFGVYAGATAVEFSGIASSPLDKTMKATGISALPSSGVTATTTQADELLIGAIGAANGTFGTFMPGASYTQLTPTGTCCGFLLSEFRTVAATGAYAANGTFMTSDEWGAAIATYKGNACATDMQNPTVTPPANTTFTQTLCN